MIKPEILSSSNHRILRNGKIVTKKKNNKKKFIPKSVNDKSSILPTTSSDLKNVIVKSKNDYHKVMERNYKNILGNRELCILLTKIPLSQTYKVPFDDKNNNSNKNGYTSIEDYIQLNEVQIYNELEPKIEKKSELPKTTGNAEQTIIPSNGFKKKINLETKRYKSLITHQNNEVRVTRGKTIERKTEERKQLDQLMFDKFPKNTFKMFAVELNDISEEVKFLKTLGLTCRFKCPLTTTTCRLKKKS